MKNILKLLLALLLAFALVACSSTPAEPTEPEQTEETEETEEGTEPTDGEEGAIGANDLYLITDVGTIDDKSFNQGSWEGLVDFAEENGVDAHYLQPAEQSEAAYETSIEEAVNAGAKIIVTPGYLFEGPVATAAAAHPEVNFVLVDGVVDAPNVTSITYQEEQAGFLAGYAAVKEGLTNIGFMGGMAVPAVIRFGYGFLAGADYAAGEDGVTVNAKYTYLGDFVPTPEFQTMAASWYNDGVQVIHAAAGGAGNSVMAAAEQTDTWAIGVDVDQKDESEKVLTSAMKGLRVSVADAVKSIYAGENLGTHLVYGVAEKGVQISDDLSRFTKFNQEMYDAIYAKLEAGEIEIPTNETTENVTELTFENLTVESIGE